MKNRNYIGKAKEGNYGTLRVNIKMSEAETFIREHKDEKYLTFYISKMQQVDSFGNSHTAYCLPANEEATNEQPAKVASTEPEVEKSSQPKAKKKKEKAVRI
ncbi:hypothetical protein BH11BAC1_BH11BAC1_29800 [soil metagenome]